MKSGYSKFLKKLVTDMGKGLQYKVKRGLKLYVPNDLSCIE